MKWQIHWHRRDNDSYRGINFPWQIHIHIIIKKNMYLWGKELEKSMLGYSFFIVHVCWSANTTSHSLMTQLHNMNELNINQSKPLIHQGLERVVIAVNGIRKHFIQCRFWSLRTQICGWIQAASTYHWFYSLWPGGCLPWWKITER